ncbi:MAG TPA: NifB/NifX family molybdenum-iron cluster-binding protein [bacterium]|nr:NifB/NifX family molybdenum-iron cluster-binding protein [bacterium]
MKIAVSAAGTTIEDQMDERFGRCPYFLLVETVDGVIKDVIVTPNEGAIEGHGAGLKAVAQLGELGVEAVITGNLGPNAFNALAQMHISAYCGSGYATIKAAVEALQSGKLPEISQSQQAHHGMGVN